MSRMPAPHSAATVSSSGVRTSTMASRRAYTKKRKAARPFFRTVFFSASSGGMLAHLGVTEAEALERVAVARLCPRAMDCTLVKAIAIDGAREACPATCGECEPACEDDETWFSKKSSNNCRWVAEKPDSRCSRKSDDKVKAKDACPVACGTCV